MKNEIKELIAVLGVSLIVSIVFIISVKYILVLENGGKSDYCFKQTTEDLEQMHENSKRSSSFADLINKQKMKKIYCGHKNDTIHQY